jgi:transcriptional regulator with XRE-family HTH domain
MSDIPQTALQTAFNELLILLKKKGIKQKEVAELLNCNEQHLSAIKKGNKDAQFTHISKMCGKLGLVFSHDPNNLDSINFSTSNFL